MSENKSDKTKVPTSNKKIIVFLLIFFALVVGVYSLKEMKNKDAGNYPQANVTKHNF